MRSQPIKIVSIVAAICALAITAMSLPFPLPAEVPMGDPSDVTGNWTKSVPAETAYAKSAAGDTTILFCSVGAVNLGGQTNDCWGWTSPQGVQYAIAGNGAGIAFVNSETFEIVDVVPFAEGCLWKDMKTYQNYAYAVSECGGSNQGLLVMDMSFLPDSVHRVRSISINGSGAVASHNVWVDTLAGYLYTEGSSSAGDVVHIFSLSNPSNPSYVNSFGNSGGIHDMYVRNDTAYIAEGSNGKFSIWNLGNKFSPSMIAIVSVPNSGYLHNIWPTDDGKYVVTTEETGFKTVKFWDIQDLGNIQLRGEYLAPSNLAHNAQVSGNNRVYISHYESGVAVVDFSDPDNPVEIALFDTYTADESPNFNGCWGVYQYTTNGKVFASNMGGSLIILEETQFVMADTMWIVETTASPGSDVRVDVYATNTLPLRTIIVPFNWTGDFDMILDSVTTVGTRTEDFEIQQFNGQNFSNHRASYRLTSSLSNTTPDMEPGTGPILSLHFSVPFGVTGGPNPVILTPYNDKIPNFGHPCLTFEPDHYDGSVALSCCNGIRGNVNNDPLDQINVSDVTFLVDYMFRLGPDPACIDEANINGDILKSVDVSDLTMLVDYLFRGGPAPGFCAS